MTNNNLSGLGTALITPFLPNGEVDYEALKVLVNRQIEGKVDYLVVLGTTGEAVTLTKEEKEKVVGTIIEEVKGRVPLVLGMGGNCTKDVVERLQANKDFLLQHFAAILSVCPYYNKPSQEGLYQHFAAIAEASNVPIVLYNVPGRTGVNMLPETVMRLHSSFPTQIIGVKEASGNMEQIGHLIDLTRANEDEAHRLLVISGDDGIAATVIQRGGDGLISVAANAYPLLYHTLVHKADIKLQEQLNDMVRLLFIEGNPAGIKTLLSQKGLISNTLRLPLVSNSMAVQAAISEADNLLGNTQG